MLSELILEQDDMTDLDKRLTRIEDLEAIRNLIASYGPLADAGHAVDVAALWTENGCYDVGGFGVARGRDEIAALIESPTHQALMESGCAHVLSPHSISITGSAAIARGYSTVYRKTERGMEPWRVAHNTWELARQPDGGWLVTNRINRPVAGG